MSILITPLCYYGGKAFLATKLIKLVPYGFIYCEPFCGSAALFFARRPSPIEVLNDINYDIINFFRVLQDPDKFARFYYKSMLTPYSRHIWKWARDTLNETEDDVERAYKFFIKIRQSISSHGTSWSYTRKRKVSRVVDYLSALERLPLVVERLMGVYLECDDFEKVAKRYDTPDTVFYCDPPYPLQSVKNPGMAIRAYSGYVMNDDDHKRFLEWAVNAKGAVVISSYPNELYETYLKDWQKIEIETVAHSFVLTNHLVEKDIKKIHRKRIEVVWRNKRCLELEAKNTSPLTLTD